jgi:hypothetical protein
LDEWKVGVLFPTGQWPFHSPAGVWSIWSLLCGVRDKIARVWSWPLTPVQYQHWWCFRLYLCFCLLLYSAYLSKWQHFHVNKLQNCCEVNR